MVGRACCVFKCMSTSQCNKNLKFHRFPRDDRIPTWIEACRRPELRKKDIDYLYKNKHVCSLHFETFMYKKRNLLKGAIPTLKLPKVLINENESKAPITIATEILNEWDDTPHEEFLQACDKYLQHNPYSKSNRYAKDFNY